MRDAIRYAAGKIELTGRSVRRSIPLSAVRRVHLCSMEDEIHHGDEGFHILLLDEAFVLIGPFVGGAIGALDAMIRDDPAIPVERSLVGHIPFRFRKPGLLGLRLLPVPGLYVGARDRLAGFRLTPSDAPSGPAALLT